MMSTYLDFPHALCKFTLLEGVFWGQKPFAALVFVLVHVLHLDVLVVVVVIIVGITVHGVFCFDFGLGRLL
jgi:hypothetical protein